MTTIAYQKGMLGVPSKRSFAWTDMFMQYARELGDRPDLNQTEWYKRLVGMAYAKAPEMRDAIEATIKKGEVEFGLQIMERFFTLPAMPAPDTFPRALRGVRKEMIDSGLFEIKKPANDSLRHWNELLTEAEEGAGNYNSGIEARFGQRLKSRFHQHFWEENKVISKDGKSVVPDFICETLALSIEVDSLEFHSSRDIFTSDRKKARLMQLWGYHHLQFSGPELSIPNGLILALGEIETFIKKCKT